MKSSVTFGRKAANSSKKVTILAMSLLALNGFAQTADSLAIEVVYNQAPPHEDILFFINGNLVPNLTIRAIAPNSLKNIDVSKKDTLVGGRTYTGVIRMTMKDEYAPSFVSLTELKHKYMSIQPGPTIFMIDNQIINGNHDMFTVDEKNILKIEVTSINIMEGSPDINVVKLLTKSEENIRKSKEIWFRGNSIEPTANNRTIPVR